MVRRLLALAMFVALAGCQADPPPAGKPSKANEPAAKAVRPVPAREGELKLPDGMRLPSVQYVEAAQSWNDRLATLTTSERAHLESLNFRYYGTLEFNSPEEQRKLLAAGVPMPEEWLAASRMSDEELASLADARSPKASLFFADRQLDKFIDAQQRLEGSGIDPDFHSDVINSRAQALVYAGQALALTRSPFAAYLYGSLSEKLYGGQEYTAAAISVAGALGDERARVYAHELVEQRRLHQAPPLNFESIATIEKTMWRYVHRYRPL